jgi:acetyl-CoA acetyltransferase
MTAPPFEAVALRDRAAIVGVGATPIWKRGRSAPRTTIELAGDCILAAVADAGLRITDVDGFAYFAGGFDSAALMETLGIPEVRFSAGLTGTGGGSAGAVGLAAMAVATGQARCIVVLGGQQQAATRYGEIAAGYAPDPDNAFYLSAGLFGPAQMFALLARRHMHLYGTTRAHFAEIAMSCRANALRSPGALMTQPMDLDAYYDAPMVADPHGLFDCCLESDGLIACVITSTERARDLAQPPVLIRASAHGGARDWGRSIYWFNMPDDAFASSGHAPVARDLWARAGLGPEEVDCVQIYDHFTSQVLMQLEDYGFCAHGEAGPFVASGAIRAGGALPLNTDGGQLSHGFVWGMTHIREAVAQLRGRAAVQVPGAEVALVTGGPSPPPVSGLILRKA